MVNQMIYGQLGYHGHGQEGEVEQEGEFEEGGEEEGEREGKDIAEPDEVEQGEAPEEGGEVGEKGEGFREEEKQGEEAELDRDGPEEEDSEAEAGGEEEELEEDEGATAEADEEVKGYSNSIEMLNEMLQAESLNEGLKADREEVNSLTKEQYNEAVRMYSEALRFGGGPLHQQALEFYNQAVMAIREFIVL
eukprot:gnl/MRDRNA2_/MRDRNA2_54999_c0_seq2.p1 gnl/MRDRNA2_/MRDRNA2_54999_c0~~gnl/MRDRNA2_/MRDRNA2_54999_c0_seq2.p1  ORF type:complete len:192 (+),score=77.02 gnl/MRDRNA2_/MRDRNA2_54999_c0_seq2:212-787(+)